MNNRFSNIKKYLISCFLLMVPIMAWNIFLAGNLPPAFQPEIFWNKIPPSIAIGEQVSRIVIFALTIVMPLSVKSKTQRMGIFIYVIGVLIYFASWLALIYYPHSKWSSSYFGFLSPAYTPVVWLTGIALTGHKFYFNWPYRRWTFIVLSIVFLIFHNIHSLIIYNRIH